MGHAGSNPQRPLDGKLRMLSMLMHWFGIWLMKENLVGDLGVLVIFRSAGKTGK